MRTIIAGSRSLGWVALGDAVEEVPWDITAVVCGCGRGIDREGERWAHNPKARIVPVSFWPAWDNQFVWATKAALPGEPIHWSPFMYRQDRSAGFERNRRMAEDAEALLAVWDGQSHGTKNMIAEAEKRGLKVFVWIPGRGAA